MVKTSMSMCLGCGVFKLSEELSKREYCDKCEARLQSIDWLKHICKTKSERDLAYSAYMRSNLGLFLDIRVIQTCEHNPAF